MLTRFPNKSFKVWISVENFNANGAASDRFAQLYLEFIEFVAEILKLSRFYVYFLLKREAHDYFFSRIFLKQKMDILPRYATILMKVAKWNLVEKLDLFIDI